MGVRSIEGWRRVAARVAGGRAEWGGAGPGIVEQGARGVGCARQRNHGPCVVGGGDLLSAMGLARGGSGGIVELRGLVTWRPSRSPPRGDVGPVGVQNTVTWRARRRGEAGAVPRSGAGITCAQQSCESFDTKSVG